MAATREGDRRHDDGMAAMASISMRSSSRIKRRISTAELAGGRTVSI
jgi:hypothetical protein